MPDLEQPFTREEYQGRLARIRERMAAENIDLSFLTSPEAMKRYYMGAGIWEERWWVGGYDLGISFPPDWVGTFVYDPEIDPEGRRFVPGTVVNYESDFFLPQMAGLSLIIDTMMFTETGAELTQSAPHEVIVIE